MKRLLPFGRSLKETTKILGALLIPGLLSFSSIAQTTFTIGTGTATNSNIPITSNYGYSYTQQIMYASELQAAGGGAGAVSKIRFFLNSGSTTLSDGWRILMGNTVKTQFTSNTDWEVIGNLTEVFNGTVTFPAGGNWMEITLATPFNWDGVSNIVVAVDENTPSFGTLVPWRHTTTTGVNRGIYYRNDSTNPDPASPQTATGRTTSYANMQFVMSPSTACAGTPTASVATVSSPAACVGSTVNVTLNNSYFLSGIQYQWQKNETGTWEDIAGATSSTLTTAPVFVNTMYRANVTCANSLQTTSSEQDTVTAVAYPVLVLNETEVATCNGEPANITVTGATTYTWSPATALAPNVNASTVTMIPAVPTVYTVIGSTSGCKDTATVSVIPVSQVSPEIAQNPVELCTPGSSVELSLSGIPSTITSDGIWQYRWLDVNGAQIQDWNTADEYAFIPTEDSVYSVYYQLRSTSCPDNYIDSVKVDIVVGFGADVALTDFNCNSQGIIALSDIFGQTSTTEIYENDLSSPTSLDNIVLSGNASVTAGRVQLTPSLASQTGYMQLSLTGQELGLNNAMTVRFNMTNDTPLNNFGTGGADGLTYSFGDDATPAGNGTPPNGKGTKLRLSFDSASNGTENGNAPGIYLVYGWTAGNAFGPGSAQTLAYNSNISLWKTLTDVPVELNINDQGKATVTVNGVVVMQDIQLPAAYMNADASNWKHLFSAGTGGDALRQGLSDLWIGTQSLVYGISQGAATVEPSEWQSTTTFSNLTPGIYNVWIAQDETADCGRNIGQFEILNTYPVVDLGEDMAICEDDTVTLDAGNPGSVYTWSGSNAYTQTIEVSEAGSYIVYVTNPEGCLGIGTINIDVNEAPSVAGIFTAGEFPTVTFSALNAQNTNTYTWNFGDGTAPVNGPATIAHSYDEDGTFSVSLIVTNDCGSDTITQSITIHDFASLSENAIEGLQVYPNPATNNVTIKLPNNENSSVAVYNMSGALVQSAVSFTGQTSVTFSGWEKGVYFLRISNGTTTTIEKLIVQ